MPAKNITMSIKDYEALGPYDQCATHNWLDDGCRILSRDTEIVHTVTAMKPTFDYFPPDALISTDESPAPADGNTGGPATGIVRHRSERCPCRATVVPGAHVRREFACHRALTTVTHLDARCCRKAEPPSAVAAALPQLATQMSHVLPLAS